MSQPTQPSSPCAQGNRRLWTREEETLYAKILANPKNKFIHHLEYRAVRFHNNEDLFKRISEEFEAQLNSPQFKAHNEAQNFMNLDGTVKEYGPRATDPSRLRDKYKKMKSKWVRYSEGGSENYKRPHWYDIMNPVFQKVGDERFTDNDDMEDTQDDFNVDVKLHESDSERLKHDPSESSSSNSGNAVNIDKDLGYTKLERQLNSSPEADSEEIR